MLVDSGPFKGRVTLDIRITPSLEKEGLLFMGPRDLYPLFIEGRETEASLLSSTTTIRRNASTTTAAATATASRSSSSSAVRLHDSIGETTKEAKVVGV